MSNGVPTVVPSALVPLSPTDVDDQRVVELALVFDLLNYPANLIVGISRVGGKDVRLTDEELLFIGAERLPFREFGAAKFGLSIRPGRELGIRPGSRRAASG